MSKYFEGDQMMIFIATHLVTYVIIFINQLLETIFKYFCEFEKYNTYSEYLDNYVTKLGFAQFINTTVITLMLSLENWNIWGIGGLTTTIYYFFVNNAIIPIIVRVFRSTRNFWWKATKRWWYRKFPTQATKT